MGEKTRKGGKGNLCGREDRRKSNHKMSITNKENKEKTK